MPATPGSIAPRHTSPRHSCQPNLALTDLGPPRPACRATTGHTKTNRACRTNQTYPILASTCRTLSRPACHASPTGPSPNTPILAIPILPYNPPLAPQSRNEPGSALFAFTTCERENPSALALGSSRRLIAPRLSDYSVRHTLAAMRAEWSPQKSL